MNLYGAAGGARVAGVVAARWPGEAVKALREWPGRAEKSAPKFGNPLSTDALSFLQD